jgi:hypothetical protein
MTFVEQKKTAYGFECHRILISIAFMFLHKTKGYRPRSQYEFLESYISGIIDSTRNILLVNTKDQVLEHVSHSPLSTGVLCSCSRLQRVTLPDAVRIQLVLLKMGMLTLETCRG